MFIVHTAGRKKYSSSSSKNLEDRTEKNLTRCMRDAFVAGDITKYIGPLTKIESVKMRIQKQDDPSLAKEEECPNFPWIFTSAQSSKREGGQGCRRHRKRWHSGGIPTLPPPSLPVGTGARARSARGRPLLVKRTPAFVTLLNAGVLFLKRTPALVKETLSRLHYLAHSRAARVGRPARAPKLVRGLID